VDALVAGPLFSRYSKNPDFAFDNAARLARKAELAIALEPELEAATRWLERAMPDRTSVSKQLGEVALAVDL
jgi:hypothetical protein